MKYVYNFYESEEGMQIQIATFYKNELIHLTASENGPYHATVEITVQDGDGNARQYYHYKRFRWRNSDGSQKCLNSMYKMGGALVKELIENGGIGNGK